MDYWVVIIIAFIATLQSFFGVGVLLFGTPILLLYGYSFESALLLLLPISICINFLQIATHINLIEKKLLLSFFIYCMPFIAISLMLVLFIKPNFSLLVGIFLLFSSITLLSKNTLFSLQLLLRHENLYFMIMGIVHGFSNLGGSLLSPFMLSKFSTKAIIRVNIASLYICFAIIQLLTLFYSGIDITVNYTYIGVGLGVYSFVNLFFDKKVSTDLFIKLFGVLLFICGIVLILKSGYFR